MISCLNCDHWHHEAFQSYKKYLCLLFLCLPLGTMILHNQEKNVQWHEEQPVKFPFWFLDKWVLLTHHIWLIDIALFICYILWRHNYFFLWLCSPGPLVWSHPDCTKFWAMYLHRKYLAGLLLCLTASNVCQQLDVLSTAQPKTVLYCTISLLQSKL